MLQFLDNKRGFAALIGLLLVVLIIALLTYGGSFFSKEEEANSPNVYIDAKIDAEKQIESIEKNLNNRN